MLPLLTAPLHYSLWRFAQISLGIFYLIGAGAFGQVLDYRETIGLNALRLRDPSLTGSGVTVAQVEAPQTLNGSDFEVNPANSSIGQTAAGFVTYRSSAGTSTTLGGAVGSESSHANTVGSFLFGAVASPSPSGPASGVAPGITHVDNYEAGFFVTNIVSALIPPTIAAKIVNQSFVAVSGSGPTLDRDYDDYAENHNTLFVSGAGNGGAVLPPSTAYNGISVAAFGGSSSTGPTTDGRSKPDLTAPAGFTSFSTPQVAGAAAILVQAGERGDGGSTATNKVHAQDIRTLKALLLNGAVKPSDWAHTSTAPLDPRYGAGVLNLNNSYTNLTGGEHPASVAGSLSGGATGIPQAPPNTGTDVSTFTGWNLSTLTNQRVTGTFVDVADHYFFTLTDPATYDVTCTLTWNRQAGQATINNLDFFLLDASSGSLLGQSTSTVDNVEHLYLTGLAPGRYDLQVLKFATARVTTAETYSIAYQFVVVPEPTSASLCATVLLMGIAAGRPRRRRNFRAPTR